MFVMPILVLGLLGRRLWIHGCWCFGFGIGARSVGAEGGLLGRRHG